MANKPIKYRRIKGPPATVTRAEPDERLERSKRWKRVDDGAGKAGRSTNEEAAS